MTLSGQDLAAYYRAGSFQYNHPPPISLIFSHLFPIAKATGISFPALLRLPFALFDLASVWLILRLLSGHPNARLIAALFWLHPLAIIYSSYHGNTDSAIACFLLACACAVTRGRGAWAGAILGLSLWVKIPGILAGPAMLAALPNTRERVRFCLAGAAVVMVGFGHSLFVDAEALINAVVLYPGLRIHTSSGVAIWGLLDSLPDPASLPQFLRLPLLDLRALSDEHNTLISVTPIVVFAWLRRDARDAVGIAGTIAGSYALFYGLTNSWAFQYFAWTIPFWLICSRTFGVLASALSLVYVYGAYAWFCGDLLLLGEWDFMAKPDWPSWLIGARNAANFFFFASGIYFLARAVADEIRRRRSPVQEEVRD